MSRLTATERSLQNAANALRGHAAGKTNTGPAREAFLSRFEQEVDPDGVLDPETRAKRADQARRAYFKELALRSARARRRKAS